MMAGPGKRWACSRGWGDRQHIMGRGGAIFQVALGVKCIQGDNRPGDPDLGSASGPKAPSWLAALSAGALDVGNESRGERVRPWLGEQSVPGR
jgi:hypothetical protein